MARTARRRRPAVRPARGPTRVAVVVAASLLTVLVTATGAAAHADFVSAVPSAGSGIPQAPGDVVLRFSEPLIPELSDVRVVDAAGGDVTDGPTRPVPGDDRAMQRSLGLLEPGRYTVRWTTTSPLDGHTLRGSYAFGVGVMTLGDEQVVASPLASEGWVGLAARWLLLAGLGLWSGVLVLRRSPAWTSLPPTRRRGLAGAAPLAVVVGGTLALLGSAINATGGLDGLPALVASQSGGFRLALPAVGLVGVLAAREHGVGWSVVHGGAGGLAVLLEAASGHAASSTVPTIALPLFAAHLAAAGTWVTAIVLALAADTPREATVRRLARPAVWAAVVTGVTGVLTTTVVLHGLTDLAATAYGRTLAVKTAAVLVMAGLGLRHRHRRQVGGRLGGPLRAELAASLLVIALATALVGFPNPPAETLQGQRRGSGDPLLASILSGPAVSLAQADGPFVVGLTIAPPAPGIVEVRVQVEGVAPGDGLRDMQIRVVSPSGETVHHELAECGFGCFAGRVDMDERGSWQVEVEGRSNRQPVRASFAVPMPTPDGRRAFDRMMAAMQAAETAVVTEDLRASEHDDPITSQYTFRAPDRMRWEVDGASVRIAIGPDGYSGTDGEFEVYDWVGHGFNWPERFYDTFFADSTAMRLLGPDEQAGQRTQVLTFVQPDLPAWYQVWLDPDSGRMRRLRMLTEGHLMVQDYRAYDEPVAVEAPPAEAITGRR